eukprot:jgi/Ulvmu1/1411/UM011_0140.1
MTGNMYSLCSRIGMLRQSVSALSCSHTASQRAVRVQDKGHYLPVQAARTQPSTLQRTVRAFSAATEVMTAEAPVTKYRKDYTPTPYLIDSINLDFTLTEESARVTATSQVKLNHEGIAQPMCLNGRDDVTLESVEINGSAVDPSTYEKTPKLLTLNSCPQSDFELKIVTVLKPQENTLLEGLYKSSGNFCTQCEAEGFRGITFFYDRPDVMSKYTVRVTADKEKYPVLLSNGNLTDSGDLPEGRHFTTWEDPYPKPCYLFALVAGNLAMAEDTFITASGREVALRFYTEHKDIDKVQWAMSSLKQSMKWDEERYGLEYDLSLFNVVSVSDFSMGAMENKSLNIFNSRLVLASPETATDGDFNRIQGVIGHEYFHNWTGNRVTCRDWFQLTLKEGLTVYRDSEFTSDMTSRAVKRIQDVTIMRTAQFAQDAGPMAHPIRPDEYVKMDNFYTVTVYEKGCEVIRMYETILGRDGFRKGMDLYFKRHDGCAVTCDDFLAAMADANNADLSALSRWYGQAGTPQLSVSTVYDASAQTYTITARQVTPPTKGQPDKVPLLIPIGVGLLGPDGSELPFTVKHGKFARHGDDKGAVLLADEETSTFVLSGVSAQPVPSLLRNFSAPVTMIIDGQTDEDLTFIMANDTDAFNKWDAAQRLGRGLLLSLYDAAMSAGASNGDLDRTLAAAGGVSERLIAAYRSILTDSSIDGSLAAMTLALPSQSELVQSIPEADPVVVHGVLGYVRRSIAQQLMPELLQVLKENDTPAGEPFSVQPAAVAKRAFKNTALALLCATDEERFLADALERFNAADNMTDSTAAISAVLDKDCPQRTEMLEKFYEKWQGEELVVLKWLTMHATSGVPGNLAQVKDLTSHPAFKITNPNCCYSLLLGMSRSATNFHAADGSGYEFIADMVIKVDSVNHQVAARIASAFTSCQQLDQMRQALIQKQLKRILAHEDLSENVQEILSKTVTE